MSNISFDFSDYLFFRRRVNSIGDDSGISPYFCTSLHCRCANEKPSMPTYQVSKEKIKSLGIDYIPIEDSLKETVESLKEKKFFGVSAAM